MDEDWRGVVSVVVLFAVIVLVVLLVAALAPERQETCTLDVFEDTSAVIKCDDFIVVRDAETGEWR